MRQPKRHIAGEIEVAVVAFIELCRVRGLNPGEMMRTAESPLERRRSST